MPGTASRPQPIGMDPLPAIADTINRGTGDPAVVRSTLHDPNNPNGRASTCLQRACPEDAAGTANRAVRSGQGMTPPTSPPAALYPRRPPRSLHRLPVPRPPMPRDCSPAPVDRPATAAAANARRFNRRRLPSLQPVPEQQPGIADPALARSPDQAPAPTEPEVQHLPTSRCPPLKNRRPPCHNPRRPCLRPCPPTSPAARPGRHRPPASGSTSHAASRTAGSNRSTAGYDPSPGTHGSAAAADPLLGPDPDLMPAIGPAAPPAAAKAAPKPATASSPGSAPATPHGADAPSDLPLETAPAAPVDPQPAKGSLAAAPLLLLALLRRRQTMARLARLPRTQRWPPVPPRPRLRRPHRRRGRIPPSALRLSIRIAWLIWPSTATGGKQAGPRGG